MIKNKCVDRLLKELESLEQEKKDIDKKYDIDNRKSAGIRIDKTIELLRRTIDIYQKSDLELPSIKFDDEYLSQIAKISEFSKVDFHWLYTTIDFYLSAPTLGKPYYCDTYLLTIPRDTIFRFKESGLVDLDESAIKDIDGLRKFLINEKNIFEREVKRYLSIFKEDDIVELSRALEDVYLLKDQYIVNDRVIGYLDLIKKHQDKIADATLITKLEEAYNRLSKTEKRIIKSKNYDYDLGRDKSKFVKLEYEALSCIRDWYFNQCTFDDSVGDMGQYPCMGFLGFDNALKSFDRTRARFNYALDRLDESIEDYEKAKVNVMNERLYRFNYLKKYLEKHGVIFDEEFVSWFILHRFDISFYDAYAKQRVCDITSKVTTDLLDEEKAKEQGISLEEFRALKTKSTDKMLKLKTGE